MIELYHHARRTLAAQTDDPHFGAVQQTVAFGCKTDIGRKVEARLYFTGTMVNDKVRKHTSALELAWGRARSSILCAPSHWLWRRLQQQKEISARNRRRA